MQTEPNTQPNTNTGPAVWLVAKKDALRALPSEQICKALRHRLEETDEPLPTCFELTVAAETPLVELLTMLVRDYGFVFRYRDGRIIGLQEKLTR